MLVAAALLALGAASCGDGDDSDPDAPPPGMAQEEEAGSGGGDGAAREEGEGAGEPGAGSGRGGVPGDSSGSFTPRSHEDSGGGAEQFRVRGGDNSIQDFGSEAGGSEFERAAAALHGYLDARAQGAWAAACSYLSSDTRRMLAKFASQSKRLKGRGCAATLAAFSAGAKGALRAEANRADAGSLRVEGERGFVIYRGVEKTVFAIPMAREDGGWKVAALAPTPLT